MEKKLYHPFGMKMPGRSYKPAPPTFTSPAPGGGSAASPVTLYLHNFNSGPYNHPYIITPTTLSTYLTNSGWTNSQGAWASSNGTSNGVSSPTLNVSSAVPATTTLTLTLNAQSGYSVSYTSFSFYCKSQNNGYTNWSMSINGIFVGSGTITVNNNNTLISTGNVNVANPVNGLTGTITIVITLSGGNHSASGTFRFDNFTLNGYVQQLTTGASNAKDYRYGFNGQEKSDEIKGEGNSYTAEFWEYDARLGRRWNVDPRPKMITSNYSAFENNPLLIIDRLGDTTNYYTYEGRHLGTTLGEGRVSDRYISEDFYSNIMTEINSKKEEAKELVRNNINDRRTLTRVLNRIEKGFQNVAEEALENEDISQEFDISSDVGLLARIGFAEFRGSNSIEQKVGMDITLNRVGQPEFRNTLEGVITQPLQYSSLNRNDPNRPYYYNTYETIARSNFRANNRAWIRSFENAHSVMFSDDRGISQEAVNYYSPRSMVPANSIPKWDFTKLIEVKVEGVRESHLRLFKKKE